MKHIRYEHKDCEAEWCGYCRGGLFTCTVCGASEGELPSVCPGVKMTDQQLVDTYRGFIDHRESGWVTLQPMSE